MTEYYQDKLKEGLEYQDFVIHYLAQHFGLALSIYSSKKYQNQYGETEQGIEIKFDNMSEKTGNLYIEISEKSNPDNDWFVDSGIYREDNSWLYLIGNYSIIYIFSKNILKLLYKSSRYKEVEIATSTGFLLPLKIADKCAAKKIMINS